MRNRGFGVVQILLTVLVIGAIAGIGLYVYANKDESAKNNSNSSNTTSEYQQSVPADTEAQSWKLVTSGKQGFSIRIPDGWEVANYMTDDNIRSQNLNYQKGTEAKVQEYNYSYAGDSIFRFNAIQFDNSENFRVLDGDETKEAFKTTAGVEGFKYYKKYPVAEPQGIGPYPGMEAYTYEFKTGNKTTYVIYNIFNYNQYSKNILSNFTQSDQNRVDLVDRVVNTLEIKS